MGAIERTSFTGKVTSKGQTTIPKEIREALRLKPGTELQWSVKDGMAIIRPRNVTLKDLAGMLGRPGLKRMSVEDMDKAIAAAVRERYERSKR